MQSQCSTNKLKYHIVKYACQKEDIAERASTLLHSAIESTSIFFLPLGFLGGTCHRNLTSPVCGVGLLHGMWNTLLLIILKESDTTRTLQNQATSQKIADIILVVKPCLILGDKNHGHIGGSHG